MTNRVKGIAFEKDNVHKPLEFWRTVIFSDESKFCIFGIKGRKLVWRKPYTALQKEHLVPAVRHGGSGVMWVHGEQSCWQSSDLNPTEHLRDSLERRIRQHNVSSKDMLKSVLKNQWEKKSAGKKPQDL
ncbi:transposable element Tc1 transposase [Trichonephila clavipes]|nr:transposable element Tc1 transposase [Trichonephila clavipes]